MVQARAPASPPSAPPYRQLQILFRHPGYDDSNNVLFRLHASDIDDIGQPGLYAQLALDACTLIAGNCANEGWLSLRRDGSTPIDTASTLRERSYYFHLDAVNGEPYAIVPNFRQWSYPHDRLPSHWQAMVPNANTLLPGITFAPSNLTTALLMRDGSCRLSGCREQLQVAHIVPQAELDWWRANDMSRYNTGLAATLDDTANALLLRADLHIAFDKPRIAFVPKPAGDGGGMRLVAHLLEHSPELEHLYHNRELHPTAVGIDMLYARFAWSIFTLLDAFLECKTDRRLTLRTSDAYMADVRGFVTAANCELFSAAATRKRSQSPKKRKPERDIGVEHKKPKDPSTPSRQKRGFDAQVGTASTDVISTKCARRNPPASAPLSIDFPIKPGPICLLHCPRRQIQLPALPSTSTHSPVGSPHSPLGSWSSPSTPAPLLARDWLDAERQRSDHHHTWEKERNWLRHVWDGKTLSSDEVRRWFEACGLEIRDE